MIQRRSIWMAFFVLTLFTSTQSFASDVLLGGSGCTDSEIWKVGQAQLSKNEELAATLTEIPTSDSSAIKKWNQLRKFERTLAAMPGLTGAWAYWYYRAAFSMKMLAYAEAGFLDLDKKLTQGGPFSLATKSCIKVIQRNLQGLELSSSFVKQEKEDAEFFKALEGKELGPIYQKFKVLFQKARAEGSATRADGLQIGRAHV